MDAKTQDAAGETGAGNPDFAQSFDAMDWARAFVQKVSENPKIATDESWMVSWFANAIMRGYDEHARRCPGHAEPPAAPRELTIAAPTGEAYVPWDGHDYARDRESLEECVHDAAAKVRAGDHVDIWLPTLVAHAITFLDDATLLHASRAALLAARVPAPSAPQEPRGEPGEGMVTPLVETLYALGYPPIQHAHAREALRAALSSEARDAE